VHGSERDHLRQIAIARCHDAYFGRPRDWIADALREHSMCGAGYVVDTRRFVPDAVGPFGNGGEILYSGRCL